MKKKYTLFSHINTKNLLWVLTGIVGLVGYYSSFKDAGKDALDIRKNLSFAIKNAEITHSTSAHFIPRPKIEERINHALSYTFLKGGRYTIVYGPKGIGKTELVDHTAIGKKGVVKVAVSSANTKGEVIQSITEKLLGGTTHSNLDIEAFVVAIQNSGITPTIIFDVERANSRHDDVLNTVRSLSKELANHCRCIIVLSEANAVLQFGNDERENYIYVDEMERDEARQLLEKLDVKLDAAEMDYVFDTIGTSPLKLINLADSVPSTYPTVRDYVAYVLSFAEKSLVAFVHKPILKALKDHPEGVAPKYFNNQEHKQVDLSDPAAVGAAMKAANAIVYRIELNKYMLMSTAHRTALNSFEPIVTK